jgi:hypothetical protein
MRSRDEILDGAHNRIFDILTKAIGPTGSPPMSEDLLLNRPSGDFSSAWSRTRGWVGIRLKPAPNKSSS